jgi:glutamyl-Q tRNA(Asp) synthetase
MTAAPAPRYRGRFAPSPTGPLHFGSLVAACASHLDARARGGEWLLRIEDIDRARIVPGAEDAILAMLDACGLHWDGPVVRQRDREDRYAAMLAALRARSAVYPCACTRSEIADSAVHGIDGPVYPGTCREGITPGRTARSWRLRTGDAEITFDDRIQGELAQVLSRDVGDFVLLRADGVYAYQLAVVVDDADAGITDVVRGADLLDSTPRQIHVSRQLGLWPPAYAHVPVAVDARGEKLSKQTRAAAIDPAGAGTAVWDALAFLGQQPPAALRTAPAAAIVRWGIAHWRIDRVARNRTRHAPAAGP